jgi:hypothetical protein
MTQSIAFEPTKKRLPLADLDVDAELRRFEAEESARLGLTERERWVEDMANLSFTRAQRSQVTLLVGGLTMAHDLFVEASLKHVGYSVLALDRQRRAADSARSSATAGSATPPTSRWGTLVKYLIDLRDTKGITAEDRQELRVPHGRRVRPLPLRHVRDRVPQGPARRGLRRLPRHALPAARRALAGHRRRRRPRAEPPLLHRDRQGHRAAATCSTRSPTASAPTSWSRRDQPRDGAGEAHALRGALRGRTNVFAALYRARRLRCGGAVDRTRPRQGEHHRRVLGDDHRGRRQLPAAALRRERGRRVRHPAHHRVAALQHLGGVARHARAPLPAGIDGGQVRPRGHRRRRVRRRQAPRHACASAELGLRVGFQAFAQPLGLYGYHLPDMESRGRGRHEHYSTTCAAARGTWRWASSSSTW